MDENVVEEKKVLKQNTSLLWTCNLKLNDDKNIILLSSKSRSNNVSLSSMFEKMISEFDQTLKFPTL
jgi:hypothetical protein